MSSAFDIGAAGGTDDGSIDGYAGGYSQAESTLHALIGGGTMDSGGGGGSKEEQEGGKPTTNSVVPAHASAASANEGGSIEEPGAGRDASPPPAAAATPSNGTAASPQVPAPTDFANIPTQLEGSVLTATIARFAVAKAAHLAAHLQRDIQWEEGHRVSMGSGYAAGAMHIQNPSLNSMEGRCQRCF